MTKEYGVHFLVARRSAVKCRDVLEYGVSLTPPLCTCPHGDPAALRRARRRREAEKRSLYARTSDDVHLAWLQCTAPFFIIIFFYLLPPARASLPAALARWCEPCHSELAERAAVIGGVPVEEGVVPAAAAEARKETLTLLLNGAWMTYVRPSDSGGRTLKVSLRTDGFVPVLHLQGDVAMAVNALSGMEGVRARSPVGLLSCLAPPPLRQPAVLERVHRRRRRRLRV